MEHPNDTTSTLYYLSVIKEQLQEANKQANKWGITFDVRIETTPSFCIMVTAKNGGRAYIKHIPLNDVQYFADDPNALVNEIAEATYSALLKDMLRDELRDPLKKAIINCVRMATK
jgi:hypothetical protein